MDRCSGVTLAPGLDTQGLFFDSLALGVGNTEFLSSPSRFGH
jgi:hypothetical protein